MNRREFLRSTAAAGAAVVAAPLVALAATESPEIFGTGMPTRMRDAQREYDDCMREAMRQAMLMREKVRWEIFHGVPSKLLP